MTSCPRCGEAVPAGVAFCEACGTRLGEVAAAPVPTSVAEEAAPISAPTWKTPLPSPTSGARSCFSCGGVVGPDGYCETCGTKQPGERDHFREAPAPWVAGVCDRGLLHPKNEDAMALLADPQPGSRAVLVVLDGVSSSLDSDGGSLAGARAAREALRVPMPSGMGTPESRSAAVVATFTAAVKAADDAIVATTAPDSPSPASATFAVAVIEGARLAVANVGDSRVYWLPDAGDAVQLTVDDSAAEELIAAGMAREAAENGPQGHAITRWLGKDAPDLEPRVRELDLTEPGWVLACSDGLWNYASEPAAIRAQVLAVLGMGKTSPPELALALVDYANACGGRDNITVAVARIDPTEGQSDG